MGSSEELIRLLRGNCLTEIRKIEQELLQKLNATIRDDGIIDKLKHIFSRDRYAEGVIPSSTKAILWKTMRISWLLRQGMLIIFSIYLYLYKIMIPTITCATN